MLPLIYGLVWPRVREISSVDYAGRAGDRIIGVKLAKAHRGSTSEAGMVLLRQAAGLDNRLSECPPTDRDGGSPARRVNAAKRPKGWP
jgi:hypothetical protein